VNSNHDEIDFVNNLFVALNGASIIDGDTVPDQAKFVNNAYWTGDAKIVMAGTEFTSIAAWAAASQQEILNGEFVGLEMDPEFAVDGEYRPVPPSALIDAGLDLESSAWPAWFNGLGLTDLYGTSIPQGVRADVGAAEFVPMPGDYNHDDLVNAADYIVWRKSLDLSELGLAADGNRDGAVDDEDYGVWRENFGRLREGGAGVAAPATPFRVVPEPRSSLLIIIALVLVNPARQLSRLASNRSGRILRRQIDTSGLAQRAERFKVNPPPTTPIALC
jgi:hypothetical protein